MDRVPPTTAICMEVGRPVNGLHCPTCSHIGNLPKLCMLSEYYSHGSSHLACYSMLTGEMPPSSRSRS
jgi:hypothetical protein